MLVATVAILFNLSLIVVSHEYATVVPHHNDKMIYFLAVLTTLILIVWFGRGIGTLARVIVQDFKTTP